MFIILACQLDYSPAALYFCFSNNCFWNVRYWFDEALMFFAKIFGAVYAVIYSFIIQYCHSFELNRCWIYSNQYVTWNSLSICLIFSNWIQHGELWSKCRSIWKETKICCQIFWQWDHSSNLQHVHHHSRNF